MLIKMTDALFISHEIVESLTVERKDKIFFVHLIGEKTATLAEIHFDNWSDALARADRIQADINNAFIQMAGAK